MAKKKRRGKRNKKQRGRFAKTSPAVRSEIEVVPGGGISNPESIGEGVYVEGLTAMECAILQSALVKRVGTHRVWMVAGADKISKNMLATKVNLIVEEVPHEVICSILNGEEGES